MIEESFRAPRHGHCRRECQGTSSLRQKLGFERWWLPFPYLASFLAVSRHGTKWARLCLLSHRAHTLCPIITSLAWDAVGSCPKCICRICTLCCSMLLGQKT